MAILDRVKSAWNAFRSTSEESMLTTQYGGGPIYESVSPSLPRRRYSSERTIISSIYARIAIDVASVDFRHVKLDKQKRYKEDMKSRLNDCLTLEANLDQAPREFRQDIVMTLFDKGAAAIVPVDTTIDPQTNQVFDILTLRVGEIVKWSKHHVRVNLYNEATGKRQEVTLEKKSVAIVYNPMYTVMNEPNSTLQRLIRKLSLLDSVDEASASGKLDLIIQLPYVVKSEARREQATQRRDDIAFQLKGSQYGIAYTDGTEKITQLNRPAENNLLKQVEYLTKELYSQLGITETVMNGTADEAAMLNYQNRTVEPIVDAIKEAMQRAFLGLLGTRRLERIAYFRDPFRFVPVAQIAEIADKFTRNEILSSNEIRGYMGIPPSDDPKADALVNSNINPNLPSGEAAPVEEAEPEDDGTDDVNAALDEFDATLDDVFKDLGVEEE